ncbi:unnamed protein product [Schistosoma mattheei]|uniref:Uncharacterized protein n=2 Tax=Schistosoma TaxID=6181 RepID=A0A3P7VP79_9TREM|nr:unnamed protein product [Schistosoma margrebowiei]VDP72491.1 unnamed protein product [Schistosoma mattheei]
MRSTFVRARIACGTVPTNVVKSLPRLVRLCKVAGSPLEPFIITISLVLLSGAATSAAICGNVSNMRFRIAASPYLL